MTRQTQLDRIEDKLDRLAVVLVVGSHRERVIMLNIAKAIAQVERETALIPGILAALQTNVDLVRELNTPEANALADKLEANNDALAAAIVANTPAANV